MIEGATGGWAGGECGLQKFLEDMDQETEDPMTPEALQRQPKQTGDGTDKIYVGFDYRDPDDVAALRRGDQGNFIIDDQQKYPARDFVGWLPLQGGFAGGEVGLKKFVEEGVVEVASPDKKQRSQLSPVLIGIFVATVATTGGLLLTDAISFGENLTINVNRAPLDENTKLLLEIAVGLLLTAWAGSALLAFFKAAKEKIDAGAVGLQRVAVSVAFWTVVLVATYNLAKS